VISPTNAQQRINELIASAHQTLDIEVLYITDTTIRNAVSAAKQRGVNVRVILETDTDQMSNTATTTYLKQFSIPVKFATNQFYLHAKLIIADGVALVGSTNMSPTSLTKNREVGAYVALPAEVAPIQAQFESDWNATVAQ
jgi:phosphatidylserine/phosphatidylglycerophosphate/cardiolipin synthase-like enzyme